MRVVAILPMVLGVTLAFAPLARAHADLKSVSPADGATIARAPAQVVIQFTADVEDNVKDATLLPPAGKPIKGAWAASGSRITIAPPASMAPGTWAVQWRVLGGDGHPITGSATFVLGTPAGQTQSPPAGSSHEPPPPAGMTEQPGGGAHVGHAMASSYPHEELKRVALVGRMLFFGGLLFFVGGVLFATFAAPGWQPRFWSSSLLATVLGAWIVLGTHAAMVEERSLLEMLNPFVWFSDMVSVGVRGYLLAAVLLLLVHAFRWQLEPVEWEGRDAGKPLLLLGLVVTAAGAPSLSGHAADGSYLWLRIPLDMLHVLAGAAWIGGLVQLLTIAARQRYLDPRMFPVVSRYSVMAASSVGVLVVTGVFATFNELDAGLGDLIGSTWGRLILLKVALLSATMPLANANRLRNVPGVGQDPVRGIPRLRRFVAFELVIIVWVVAATAMLVYETPPSEGGSVTEASAGR